MLIPKPEPASMQSGEATQIASLNIQYRGEKSRCRSKTCKQNLSKWRKYVKNFRYKELERMLKEWFLGARSSNVPLNGHLKACLQSTRLH